MFTSNYKPPKCCVPNCRDSLSRRHRFPKNNVDVFKKWLDILKPPNYETMTALQIYNKFYVCERHFSAGDIVPGTKRGLKFNAVPIINISGDIHRDGPNENISLELISSNTSTSPAYQSLSKVQNSSIPFIELPDVSREMSVTIQKEATAPIVSYTGSRKRKFFFTRSEQLHPTAKIMYNILKNYSKKLTKQNRKLKSYKKRLADARSLSKTKSFVDLLKYVNQYTYSFILNQIKNQKLHPKARRYTLEDKIAALALFKSSGRGYKLLSKFFALPSTRTLTNLLNKVPLRPGLNKHILSSLCNHVEKMTKDEEKVCVLVFDEISIAPHVAYNKKYDCIDGLEDLGTEKRLKIADHANVFMLRGVHRLWKQPLMFTFSKGPIKSIELKNLIKNCILECFKIGLDVIATVCDQASSNVAAIRKLLEETKTSDPDGKHFGFLIQNREIVPLFDVPHLFKGLRNNLLNKDLHFKLHNENKYKVAKWNHIQQLYMLDKDEPNYRLCSKLTEFHVNPAKINKMKVSVCTQVFSHSVGVLLKRISQWNIQHQSGLDISADETGDFILFMDELFDSLNSRTRWAPRTKPLKSSVSNISNHCEFWRNSLKTIESMKFFCKKQQKFVPNPSIKNLHFTIRGILHLQQKLIQEKNFTYILTSAFHQDPLENFFSYIRSYNCRNVNPNVVHFMSAFKSLIATNFLATHSPSSNCERDFTKGLDNLRNFLTGQTSTEIQPLLEDFQLPAHLDLSFQKKSKVARTTIVYITGYVCKKLIAIQKDCEQCKCKLLHQDYALDEELIDAKQYNKAQLTRPGSYLLFLVRQSLHFLFFYIPKYSNKRNIAQLFVNSLKQHLNFNLLNCPNHNLGDIGCKFIVRCALFWWSKNVNLILCGKNSNKFGSFLSKHDVQNVDPVKLSAYRIFQCKLKRKKIKDIT